MDRASRLNHFAWHLTASLATASALVLSPADASASSPPLPFAVRLPTGTAAEDTSVANNLRIAVTATDPTGRSPGQVGYSGADLEGECRVYIDNNKPVTSQELYDQGFEHLDSIVTEAGGIDAIIEHPEIIPGAHVSGDVNTPWHCVATTVSIVALSGYPTVAFVLASEGSETDEAGSISRHLLEFDLPIFQSDYPILDPDEVAPDEQVDERVLHLVSVNSNGVVSLDGEQIVGELGLALAELQIREPQPRLRFLAEPKTRFNMALQVLARVAAANVNELDFNAGARRLTFRKDESGVDPTRPEVDN